jgi:2-haloacid dehalogenase
MDITNFKAIIIDCDGILVNHHQGILTKIFDLQQNLPQDIPSQRKLLQHYLDHYYSLSPELNKNGFAATHCFAYQKLMENDLLMGNGQPIESDHFMKSDQFIENYQIEFTWKKAFRFVRSVSDWPNYEDAFGALQYLKKFFRVFVRCDRDREDIPSLLERLNLAENDVIPRSPNENQLKQFLDDQSIDPQSCLALTTPYLLSYTQLPHVKVLQRQTTGDNYEKAHADQTLASLVIAHQEKLRR